MTLQKLRALAIAGAALTLLFGCQSLETGPLSTAPPETPADLPAAAPIEEHAAAVAVPDAAAGPVLLTRDGALLTAVLHNRSLDVARLGPQIQATFVPEARAAFDPVLAATVSFGKATYPRVSTFSTSNNASSATGGSGGFAYKAYDAAAAGSLGQELSQLSQTVDTIKQSRARGTDRDTADGSLSIQQALPTGTMLFLTGEASDTDTERLARDYRGGWAIGLRQSLLEGAGLRPNLASLRQAGTALSRSRESFRAEVLGIVRDTEVAYWNLVLAGEVLKIRETALQLAEEQLRFDEVRLEVGKAIEGDVMAGRAERASRQADLTDAQASIREQNTRLVRLLNPGAADPWQVSFQPSDSPDVAQVPLDAPASERLALQCRPEAAAARFQAAYAELGEARTRNDLRPRLDLVGTYGQASHGETSSGIGRHLDDDYFDNYQIGLEFETPLLNRAEKARHLRSRLTTEEAVRAVAEVEQIIGEDVRQAVIEVERQWQRLESTREAVRSRAEQLRIAQGRYAAGKTSNLDLLIVQRDYIQAQVDEVTAKVRYIQSLTNLYAAEGTLLDRRGIALEEEMPREDVDQK